MKAHAPKWSPDSSTSEVTTIQLEFRDLSRVSNDPSYELAVAKVSEKVHELPKTDGLVPIFINGWLSKQFMLRLCCSSFNFSQHWNVQKFRNNFPRCTRRLILRIFAEAMAANGKKGERLPD
jgi:hypothetical protein